jgi:hypothetical protein
MKGHLLSQLFALFPELEPVYPKYPRPGCGWYFRSQGNGRFVEIGEEAGPGSPHVTSAEVAPLAISTTTETGMYSS